MSNEPEKTSLFSVFSKGILVENPTLRQTLGLCPTLAITTAAMNGLGMGAATTFVLICSGIVISLLRRIIPDAMRLPAFITVIAGFVTLTMMIVKAYFPALDQALGIYLPLIVVNCIVLGRAEVFASKHPVREAAADGLGMGVGFTLALLLMSSIREIFGAGTFFGIQVLPACIEPMLVFVTPPGGFAVLGVLIAASIAFETHRNRKHDGDVARDMTQEDTCAACHLCPSTTEERDA